MHSHQEALDKGFLCARENEKDSILELRLSRRLGMRRFAN